MFLIAVRNRLEGAGTWLAPLGLRLLLAYEFFSAGQRKLGAGLGEAPGWFAEQNFPFPFGMLPPDINWMLVTLGELVAGVALLLGVLTRFFALVLIVITTVAIAAVHWPESFASLGQLWEGYSVSRVMDDGDFRGNFRIPLLFLAMLLPLLFTGPGKLSVDHLVTRLAGPVRLEPVTDAASFALAAAVGSLLTIWLIPSWGIVLGVVAVALFVRARMSPGTHSVPDQ
ncbi:MAG: DoxX family membrane protein [Gammaproteobacteria bacterium]|jgi:putative oxidoreductase|nr:DoxX family membrane protein [Gammaproteobacteria bacterium]